MEEKKSSLLKGSVFEVLFKHAAIGVCEITADGHIRSVNPYFEKLFGYSSSELVKKPLTMLLPGITAHIDSEMEHLRNPEGNVEKQSLHAWAQKKDGHQFLTEISFGGFLTNREILIVFVADLTKETFSDNKFRIFFYRSPIAKILSDGNGKIVDVNENFCRLSGYSREELIDKTPSELGFIDAEKRMKAIELVKKKGRLINNEVELTSKLGEKIFAQASTEQIEILDETFLLSTFVDVTLQKKANETLQQAKNILEEEAEEIKRLNELGNRLWKLDNLQDGLKEILNSSIQLTRADKGDIQLYDADKEALIMNVSQGFSTEFLEYFNEVTAGHSCTCGVALRNQVQFVTEDTEREWEPEEAAIARHDEFRSCQSTPLLYRDGSPMGMISTHFKKPGKPSELSLKKMELYALVAENFLERIKNYETIKNYNAELEQKIAERTKELIVSLEYEKYLNEMKSRFVSMASHEFRTPLTTIRSSLNLIKMYEDDNQKEKRNKHITRIGDSITSMVDILNDFLSLEKLQQGRVETINEKSRLNELVEDILEEMNGLLKQGQQIALSCDGEDEIVQDKNILKNVLRNLLSNATKYSAEGKEIMLSVEIADNLVFVKVKDNGIGISDEEQAYLFSNFFRAKNAASIQGTGLGLTIVKKYVELLKGSISFTSKLNEGTTFIVCFPQTANV